MKGFFTKEQIKSKSRPDGKSYSCASCGLYQFTLSPRMDPFGNFKKRILNIGEAPGEEEDRKGKQWQGKMGRTLQRAYRNAGIDLFEDCLNINAVNCRPVDGKGNNRVPTDYEIACCRSKVLKIIAQYKPHVIVLHGGVAVKSLIGHRWKKNLGGITKWRGWTIPDRDFSAWICPVFHPSYIERQPKDEKQVETIWEQDLERAFSMIEVPFPNFPDESKQVIIVKDRDEILGVLNQLNMGSIQPDPQLLAWDIESTGLKPYDTRNHKVACVSFCDNPNRAYVIPAPKRKAHKKAFQALLQNPQIGKIAANMKFEELWMQALYGFGVFPWKWDTMQAAHVLDNRSEITSLKFQAYINFGLIDYDSEVEDFLKGQDPKNSNSVNKVDQLLATISGREKLMTYCGMDSLLTYKLALKQMKEIGKI